MELLEPHFSLTPVDGWNYAPLTKYKKYSISGKAWILTPVDGWNYAPLTKYKKYSI